MALTYKCLKLSANGADLQVSHIVGICCWLTSVWNSRQMALTYSTSVWNDRKMALTYKCLKWAEDGAPLGPGGGRWGEESHLVNIIDDIDLPHLGPACQWATGIMNCNKTALWIMSWRSNVVCQFCHEWFLNSGTWWCHACNGKSSYQSWASANSAATIWPNKL